MPDQYTTTKVNAITNAFNHLPEDQIYDELESIVNDIFDDGYNEGYQDQFTNQ